ncbi:unnamed protein product [Linum tenue]|uniref:Uncharacterized protein n=1 Tax=Linum tenue TaxID=586396 RepID=A0AAV0PE43_9ROSI|nr:unnamed protein product [Linum tenue]
MKYQDLLSHCYNLLGYYPPIWASTLAGALMAVSLSLSCYLLFEHLSAYKNPEEQKFLIGVILMVPCYAIESFISLVHPSISVDVGILRDCYESFAMYCFGRYLVACLGGEERAVEFMERQGRASTKTPLLEHAHEKGTVKHPFPMKYFLKPWRLGRWFYQVVKFGIVQYMIIKAFTSISAVVLEAFGVYCEGEFKWNCGYPYLAVVLNFSQSWALYCLVQFYTATKQELAHINPLYKFLTFKSIVFLTWWQGVTIALLSSLNLFRGPIAQALEFKSRQMGIASAVHLYVFPAKPYALMGDRFTGTISVLGDYASVDCPIDPDEVRDSERPTKLRLPQPDEDIRSGMTLKESVRDVVVGGGGFIVNDVKFTVNQAVEPVEKGITKFNEKLHKISENMRKHDKDKKRTKDDSCLLSTSRRVIRENHNRCRRTLCFHGEVPAKMAPKKKEAAKGQVIGIDLGTTYSCVAVARNGTVEIIANDQGNRTTPSSVAFAAADSERLVGEAAKNQASLNPRRTIFDAKRLIGKKFDDPEVQRDLRYLPYPVVSRGGNPYIEIEVVKTEEGGGGGLIKKGFAPEEISAMILGKMKETAESYLGEPVKGAVVTVPAYFNDMQRQATKDAGRIAGLNVLRIINEPTAAAIAYGLNNLNRKRKKTKRKILVYDLGGGTFDVSVLEVDGKEFRVLATGGDTHLGGGDFDQRVMEYFIKLIKRKHGNEDNIGEDKRALGKLRKECERAKRALSNQNQVRVEIESLFQGMDFSEPLTRAKFEELNLDLFKKTLLVVEATLKDAKLGKSEIEEVVLVGGSTRIPKLREMLKEMFGGKEPCKGVNPDEAVAYVIPRNTRIPTKMSKQFTTKIDQQPEIKIKVVQGERPLTKDCIELGSFVLSGITPAPRGVPKVEETLEIDEDGILKVTAREKIPGAESQSLTIADYKGGLTQQEIERMIKEAEEMAEKDKTAKARVDAMDKLERYIYDVKKAILSGDGLLHQVGDKKIKVEISSVGEASGWLEKNQGATREDYEKKLNELRGIWDPILTNAKKKS